MDLRRYVKTKRQIDAAKELEIKGLLNYQPWLFSEDFQTGVGLEWTEGRHSGLVYYPDIDRALLDSSPELKRLVVDPQNYKKFHEANSKLRQLYDGIADDICAKIDDVDKTSFLDVGCNTGYFPLRGARQSAGGDREKSFSESFDLLNALLRMWFKFYDAYYEPKTHPISGMSQFDVVVSMAVLCHLSQPLNHIRCLASLAKKGLFVWTLVNEDRGYTIHYAEPRGDYKDDEFPFCFDREIVSSKALLQKSLELMGFKYIYEIPARDSNLPQFSLEWVYVNGHSWNQVN